MGTTRAVRLECLISGNHHEVQAHFVEQEGVRYGAGTMGSGADGCQQESARDSGTAACRSPSRVNWGREVCPAVWRQGAGPGEMSSRQVPLPPNSGHQDWMCDPGHQDWMCDPEVTAVVTTPEKRGNAEFQWR